LCFFVIFEELRKVFKPKKPSNSRTKAKSEQMTEDKDSIYNTVETSVDTSEDIFDDVFGADEEKKAARKRMQEKAAELEEKLKKEKSDLETNNIQKEKPISDDSIDEDDDDEFMKEMAAKKAQANKNTNPSQTNDLEDDDEDEIIDDEKDSSEPELFLDSEQIKEIKKNKDDEIAKRLDTRFGKKKSDFNEQVNDGLAKSIASGMKNSILDEKEEAVVKKAQEVSGKLNLTVNFDKPQEEVEIKKKNLKMSPIEKNIVKNVIKNKANKIVKEDEDLLAESLLKEQGIHEEGITKEDEDDNEWGFKKEAETIGYTAEILKKESSTSIKPPISFLIHEETGHAYIGRKKSILKKYGEVGGLHLGRVGEDEMRNTPIYLDGLNPHVVFVCGARGSGKSYVLGVLAEELALKNKNVGIVVVDPIGVFWSMKHPNRDEKELELLAEWDMLPKGLNNTKVFIPVGMKSQVPKSTFDSTFSIQPSLLTAEDWALTFGMDRFSPTGLLLDKVLEKVKLGYTTKGENPKVVRGKEQTFSIQDLIDCLDLDSELNDRDKGYKQESIRAVVSRFDASKSWGIFDESGTPLSLLSRAGQMTILDTSFLDDTVSALVIGIISRRLLSARKLSTRREAAGKFDNDDDDPVEINVPPTWLFIDEAHTLIPGGNSKTPASKAIVEYVKQGRRPGLSLVFATQQPSAIDSRVLSQLDVIMAHKLVFDDDVKAIQKRTPAIIPGQYKKPNFIKTLPVGTALTGDRQETTARAFVMNIRPRMSQHEGRDAETIEVKYDLSQADVEALTMRIILKKLEKDPSLKLEGLAQIIETLEATYKKKMPIERIKAMFDEQGIKYDETRVYAPGVLEEEQAEKEAEILAVKQAQEEAAREAKLNSQEEVSEDDEQTENLTDETKNIEIKTQIKKQTFVNTEEPQTEYEENVELTALKNEIGEASARLLLVKYRLKKKFGLFGEEEILDRLNLKYGIIYRLKFNYFSQKDAYQIGEAYINSLSKEFIHDTNGQLKESSGLGELLDLNESEVATIKLLTRKIDLPTLAKGLAMEEGNAKRILENLAKKDLIRVEKIKETIVYSLKKEIDLPPSPLHTIMASIGKRPIIEVESIPMLEPKIKEKDAAELIKKIWHNVTIKEITQLFLPVWEGVLKKKTGEERTIRIDGINGKLIQD
jgi:hypothetical protein